MLRRAGQLLDSVVILLQIGRIVLLIDQMESPAGEVALSAEAAGECFEQYFVPLPVAGSQHAEHDAAALLEEPVGADAALAFKINGAFFCKQVLQVEGVKLCRVLGKRWMHTAIVRKSGRCGNLSPSQREMAMSSYKPRVTLCKQRWNWTCYPWS